MSATSVIPAADKALLAAQATAGPAGVDAYEAAKKELAAQQAAAVARAQAEAASRGTPGAALSASSGAASGMYDQRIASLTEAQGIAGGQAAARQQRMVDYSGAVEQARGLIGDQAKQAVAPINAETDFRIRSLERQGANDVSRIDAQIRLEAARAAAAAAKAAASRSGGGGGGGGGGGSSSKGTPNQSELRSQMTTRSQTKMGNAIGVAQQAMRQTGEQQRQAASYAGNSVNFGLREALERAGETDRTNDRNAEAARQAAAYTGRSIQEYNSQQQGTATVGSPSFNNGMVSFPNLSMTPPPRYGSVSGDPRMSAVAAAYEQAARAARASNTRTPGASTPAGPSPAMAAARAIAPLMFDDNASMFTPQQIEQFAQSPDAPLFSYLMPDADGNGAVRRIRGVDERLGGAPQYTSEGSFRLSEMARDGEVDELSRSAMRDAMMLSAFDMQDEGYNIGDDAITAALDDDAAWKIGSTYADVLGRSNDRGDVADQQAAIDEANERYNTDVERDIAARTDADKDQAAADDAADRQAFADITGLDPGKYDHFRPQQLVQMGTDVQAGIELALDKDVRDRRQLEELLVTDGGFDRNSPLDRAIIDMIAESLNV